MKRLLKGSGEREKGTECWSIKSLAEEKNIPWSLKEGS
jgi:hypothetical protein